MNDQRIVGVAREVAGDVLVDENELASKLGQSAWVVWQILCSKRARNGLSRCYGKQLSNAKGFQPMSPRTVEKAIRRLYTSCLLARIGWRSDEKGAFHARRVLGARQLHLVGAVARVAVPRSTALWMASAKAWGGARSGAGRRSDLMAKRIQEEGVDREFKRRDILNNKHKTNSAGLKESCSFQEQDSAPRVVLSELGEALVNPALPRSTPVLLTNIASAPPFPGWSIVKPACLPNPPLLQEGTKPAAQATMLLDAIDGALGAFFKIRLPRRKGAVNRNRNYKLLREFAALLIEHKIPPAVWAWWRIQLYAGANATSKAAPFFPSIKFICNVRIITEARWRFRQAWGPGELGGRAMPGPAYLDLIRTYRRMYIAIKNGAPVGEAVSKYFPGDLYDVRVDNAKREAVEIANKLKIRAEKGEFLWA